MNDNAKRWVAALRSGEYSQASATLRDRTGHCCLGVACEEYKKATGQGDWEALGRTAFASVFKVPNPNRVHDPHRGIGLLPSPVRQWLGLRDDAGSYHGSDNTYRALTADNDDGMTFEEIADIIESEPKGLFEEAA